MKKQKIIVLALSVLILFAAAPKPTLPFSARERSVSAAGIAEISKHGNVKLNITQEAVLACFDYGDILTVTFGGVSVDLPLGTAFTNVDSGLPVLVLPNDGDRETELSVNMGSFASVYGIADKVTLTEGYRWDYREGFSASTVFTLTLKEAAGYYDEYVVRNLEYTDAKSDYPALTGEQFANFREVRGGAIASGILYRAALPDTGKERFTYALNAAKSNGITFFITLNADNSAYEELSKTDMPYFSSIGHISAETSVDISSADNAAKLAAALRAMIKNPNEKFLVSCKEGKDRTGMFAFILEALMGASYAEIRDDYMTSYYNYYGITAGDKAYDAVVNGNLRKQLSAVLGVDDPEKDDLQAGAKKYLLGAGMTKSEIRALQGVLSGNPVTADRTSAVFPAAVLAACAAVAFVASRRKQVLCGE